MRVHLSEESTIDAVAGEAAPEVRRHLEACPECAARVEESRAALELAIGAEVPEPPPLYWEAFRSQVGRRVAATPRSRSWLVPALAAAAAVLIAVSFPHATGPVSSSPAPIAALPAWTPLPPAEEDEGLALLEAFERSDGTLGTALPAESVAGTLADLSEDESADLAEALRRDLGAAEAL